MHSKFDVANKKTYNFCSHARENPKKGNISVQIGTDGEFFNCTGPKNMCWVDLKKKKIINYSFKVLIISPRWCTLDINAKSSERPFVWRIERLIHVTRDLDSSIAPKQFVPKKNGDFGNDVVSSDD